MSSSGSGSRSPHHSLAVPFYRALGAWLRECTLADIVKRQSTRCDFTCHCPPSICLIQRTSTHIVCAQLPQASSQACCNNEMDSKRSRMVSSLTSSILNDTNFWSLERAFRRIRSPISNCLPSHGVIIAGLPKALVRCSHSHLMPYCSRRTHSIFSSTTLKPHGCIVHQSNFCS